MPRHARTLGWLLLAAVAFVTICPIEYRPDPESIPVPLQRIGAFALLGALFAICYPRHRWQVCAFIVAAAGGLEAAQMLDPSRHGRVADFAEKALGGTLGAIGTEVLSRLSPHAARLALNILAPLTRHKPLQAKGADLEGLADLGHVHTLRA